MHRHNFPSILSSVWRQCIVLPPAESGPLNQLQRHRAPLGLPGSRPCLLRRAAGAGPKEIRWFLLEQCTRPEQRFCTRSSVLLEHRGCFPMLGAELFRSRLGESIDCFAFSTRKVFHYGNYACRSWNGLQYGEMDTAMGQLSRFLKSITSLPLPRPSPGLFSMTSRSYSFTTTLQNKLKTKLHIQFKSCLEVVNVHWTTQYSPLSLNLIFTLPTNSQGKRHEHHAYHPLKIQD